MFKGKNLESATFCPKYQSNILGSPQNNQIFYKNCFFYFILYFFNGVKITIFMTYFVDIFLLSYVSDLIFQGHCVVFLFLSNKKKLSNLLCICNCMTVVENCKMHNYKCTKVNGTQI